MCTFFFLSSQGCAQEHFGVTPDLTCMGKVIGGGLPVGAYGGKKEIMSMVSPAGACFCVCVTWINELCQANEKREEKVHAVVCLWVLTEERRRS